MSRKNSVATRKRSKNTSSPAMQKTPEKLLDQHQHQTASHQTQAPPTIRKNIFACLFSVHNTISLSRHEQVCLMRPH